MEEKFCPFCKRLCESQPCYPMDARTIDCNSCGKFDITFQAEQVIPKLFEIDKQIALSHWIYVNSLGKNKPLFITSELLTNILPKLKLPSVDDQYVNLILYLGDNTKYPAKPAMIYTSRFSSIVGSVDTEGMNYIINYLLSSRLIQPPGGGSEVRSFILTPEGWARYGELKKGNFNSKKVFMAMEYNKPDLETAFILFKKAVSDSGFELEKLDDSLRAGLIDDQLRVNIRQSKFVISDLTYKNAGAYWEAGYAEGLGKQVIYLCEKSHWEENKTHFDTNHHTTVIWSLQTIEEDIKKLKATIRATFPAEANMEDI